MQLVVDLNKQRVIASGKHNNLIGEMRFAYDGIEKLKKVSDNIDKINWIHMKDELTDTVIDDNCEYLILNINNKKYKNIIAKLLDKRAYDNVKFSSRIQHDYLNMYNETMMNHDTFKLIRNIKKIVLDKKEFSDINEDESQKLRKFLTKLNSSNLTALSIAISVFELNKSHKHIYPTALAQGVFYEYLQKYSNTLELTEEKIKL